jgi:hypothetical protein
MPRHVEPGFLESDLPMKDSGVLATNGMAVLRLSYILQGSIRPTYWKVYPRWSDGQLKKVEIDRYSQRAGLGFTSRVRQ